MTRISLTLAVMSLVSASFTACDGDSQEPSAPSAAPSPAATATPTPYVPTPEPTPGPMNLANIGVRPPVPVVDALSEEPLDPLQYIFVLDLASGLVQPVDINDETNAQGTHVSRDNAIVWSDDDTLWLGHPSSPVEMDLDGSVRTVAASPPATPFPDYMATPTPAQSSSGAWSARELRTGEGGVAFEHSSGNPRYRVTWASTGSWSPTRDVHVLPGSGCAGWDLFLFEPHQVTAGEPATLTNLTASDGRRYWHHGGIIWAPDGVRLAAGATQSLVVIDTASMAISDVATTTASPNWRYELRPLAWSPSGAQLLFQRDPAPQIDCTVPPYYESALEPQ